MKSVSEVERLQKELCSYRFEGGRARRRIKVDVATQCIKIARWNGSESTATEIRAFYKLDVTDCDKCADRTDGGVN